MSTASPCWYAECDVTIPSRVRYVPLDGERFQEQHVRDERALLAHLADAHPYVPRQQAWNGRAIRA